MNLRNEAPPFNFQFPPCYLLRLKSEEFKKDSIKFINDMVKNLNGKCLQRCSSYFQFFSPGQKFY